MKERIKRLLLHTRVSQLMLLIVMLLVFIIIMVLPMFALLSKAFHNNSGQFIGFGNFRTYFENPALLSTFWNTVTISLVTTFFSVILGFLYAYAVTRTNIPLKRLFRYMAMIPIFIPTIAHAVGLISLFGRQGIVTQLGFEMDIFGRTGIILSHIIFTFPQSFLMFFVTLEYADGQLYDAAESMGVSSISKLFKITFPEVKLTLINTTFVCFTLAFTDFGAPMVIGGGFNVLATDLFVQITGLFDFNMGAVVGVILLVPAALAFAVNQVTNSTNVGTINAKSTKLAIRKSTVRDIFFLVLCSIVAFCFITLICALAIRAFTAFFPFNMTPTLRNFEFSPIVGGIGSFSNSIYMSILSASIGTVFVFIYSYMIEKSNGLVILKKTASLFSMFPLTLPGMVIGVSYIFFFNNPNNPLNFVFGTVGILIIANVLNFFSVPFLTTTSALRKHDSEYESVSDSMGIPRWKLLYRVTIPLSLTAITETFIFYFVNSMVTISALVFLYTSHFRVASISISHMHSEGAFSQAAAMSLLIFFVNVVARILYEFIAIIVKGKRI